MRLLRLTFLNAILVLFIVPAYSQAFNTDEQKLTAKDHINRMKDGVLVIRMRDRVNQRTALAEIGDEKRTKKMEAKWAEQDQKIIDAFRIFSFAQPAMIGTSDWEAFNKGDYSMVKNLDGTSLKIKNIDKLYVLDPYDVALNMQDIKVIGFGIMDKHGILLEDPFPYYILKREGTFFARKDYPTMVQFLERALIGFYEKDYSKKSK